VSVLSLVERSCAHSDIAGVSFKITAYFPESMVDLLHYLDRLLIKQGILTPLGGQYIMHIMRPRR